MASPTTVAFAASAIGNVPPSSQSSPDRPPRSERLRRGRLIVVAGPGGAGKSTIVSELRRRLPVHFSVSVTTRGPRPGEVDGFHYSFIDEDRFREMIEQGELLEWAEFNRHLYGTPRAAVEAALDEGRDVLLEIDVQGARQVREMMPEAVMVFVAPPSMGELEKRLRARGDTSEEDIAAKLRIATEEIEASGELFDHVVVNDHKERAVAEVVDFLQVDDGT